MQALRMALKNTKLKDLLYIGNEKYASSHINITGHYDDKTIIDIDDKLIQIVKLHGLNATKYSDDELALFKERRNAFFKDIPGDIGLYFWTVREKITVTIPGEDKFTDFALKAHKDYQAQINNKKLFQNTHYLAFITKANNGKLGAAADFFKKSFFAKNNSSRIDYLAKKHEQLKDIVDSFISRFKAYSPQILTIKKHANCYCSELLEFIAYLVNQEQQNVRLISKNAGSYLPRKRLFFNRRTGFIQLRAADNSSTYAAILAIKDYCSETFAGMLDALENMPFEVIITQSYASYHRDIAKAKLKRLNQDRRQSEDVSITQTEEITETVEALARNENGLGIHHFNVLIKANQLEILEERIKAVQDILDNINIVAIKEDIGSEAAFWAQLPGNFSYIARGAILQSTNIASFFSLHNSAIGKKDNNHWGDCVTILETLSASPYYFNIHAKDLGVMLCFGVSGSGKTTLAGFLLLQTLKFGGRRIIFDKDNGLKILVKATDGAYIDVIPNTPSGMNPCLLEDTPLNRQFLIELFAKILSTYNDDLNENDMQVITSVIDQMYNMPKQLRRFCNLAPFFQTSRDSLHLKQRFDEWHTSGQYAWVFDNEFDEIKLKANIIGIDVTNLMDAKGFKTPAIMYLIYKAKQALYGVRGGMIFDEGWKLLDDPYFAKTIIEDQARTARKKNDFMLFLTQETEDTVNSRVCAPLNRAATVKIFFPNPTASKKVYMEGLGLSEQGFQLVKTMSSEGRYFLLDFAKGSEVEIVRLNLKGLDDVINIISSRQATVALMHKLIKEARNHWLERFLIKAKELAA